MKKTLTLTGLLAGTLALHAQGTIDFRSYVPSSTLGGYSITIYSVNNNNPGATEITGNTGGSSSSDLPSGGTQTYANETPLGGTTSGTGAGTSGQYNGNNYTVGFYVATSLSALTADVTSGTPVAQSLMDTTYGPGASGTYDPNDTSISYNVPGVPSGSSVYVAIAAWYSANGAGSYAAAKAAGLPAGVDYSTSAASLTSAPAAPANLAGIGLTSFDLTSTPEPSTIALGVMGASALLFRRRK